MIDEAPNSQTWEHAEKFLGEISVTESAQKKAEEVGCVSVGNGTGGVLQLLARSIQAKNVVEVGTGTGTSALWLLGGMTPDGVLTSVDGEAEHQKYAREVFELAGVDLSRVRLITGRATDVLTRLTDDAYDLIFINEDAVIFDQLLDEALRLTRPGGFIVFEHALRHNRVADLSQRDTHTVATRQFLERVREEERLMPVLLPVGDGLMVAIKDVSVD